MSREEIIALFATRHDRLARHDAAALALLHDEGGDLESPTAGGTVSGRETIEQVYRAWFTAFPNLAFNSEELLIDGDRVAEVGTITGSHMGSFMGLPPSDRPFHLPMIVLYTVHDGRIRHERRIYDFTGLLVQIGVLKAKPG